MFSDQAQLQLRKFAAALDTLKETAKDDEDRKTRDSLLLRYVYTFEMAWQCIRAVLQDRGDDETPRVAFAALETGFRVGYITDAALWKSLREGRNRVSHVYDESMAIALAVSIDSACVKPFALAQSCAGLK